MNKQGFIFSILVSLMLIYNAFAQENVQNHILSDSSPLFSDTSVLAVKMTYSNRQLKKETNDSTYIPSVLSYQLNDEWHDLDLEIRSRGNYRLKNCYFIPLKLSIKKKVAKGTLFEGHKKLKVVLPCLQQKDKSDNVLKEYLAYKMYEHISPFYFKTRLVEFTLLEPKGKKIKEHNVRAFLIEDDKTMAKRLNGKVLERSVHAINQDDLISVRHAFFQFLIGNTDFSQVYQHNVKLVYADFKMLPVPYDFDMAGLVNTSYAVVSQVGKEKLNLTSVTQRQYRGFARERKLFQQVRQEYLDKQEALMQCFEACKSLFEDEREYNTAREFVLDFFKILKSDKSFRNQILDKLRTQ